MEEEINCNKKVFYLKRCGQQRFFYIRNMKRFTYFLLFILIFPLLYASCHYKKRKEVRQKEANEYLQSVISQTDKIVNLFNAFIQFSSYNQLDSMKVCQKRINSSIEMYADSLQQLEPYKDQTVLRDGAIEYLKGIKDINDNEFSALIDLYSIPEDKFTNADNNKIDSVSNSLDTKISNITNKFLIAQTDFAKRHKLKLNFDFEIDSTLAKGVDTSVIVP